MGVLDLDMVEGCPCASGCPGCVGPGSSTEKNSAKAGAIEALQALIAGVAAPTATVGSEAAG